MLQVNLSIPPYVTSEPLYYHHMLQVNLSITMLQVNLSKPFTCGNWTSLLPPYVECYKWISLSPSPVAIEPLYYHHMLQVNLSKSFTCGNWTSPCYKWTSLSPSPVVIEPLYYHICYKWTSLQVNLSITTICYNWTSLLPPYVTSEPLYDHHLSPTLVIKPLCKSAFSLVAKSLCPPPLVIEAPSPPHLGSLPL